LQLLQLELRMLHAREPRRGLLSAARPKKLMRCEPLSARADPDRGRLSAL
jgi:hypothetical protein